jgi:hypothetical protein
MSKNLYKKDNWLKKNIVEITILIIGLIIISLVFYANIYKGTNSLKIKDADHFGDFVGGLIGTIFTLFSIVLLYSTLKEQRLSSSIDKFENKFFELMRIHRQNVDEMNLKSHNGKKIFVMLIRELREAHKIIKDLNDTQEIKLNEKELFKISYYILFYGYGPNSTRILNSKLIHYLKKDFINEIEGTINAKNFKEFIKEEKKLDYIPFEGHQSRLGHYYRHLYQTIVFVDEQQLNINKYEYVKMLRAQLSIHEQALLFINSLSDLGEDWWSSGLMHNYKFVKNIPEQFFDKNNEIDYLKCFPKGYFE